KRANRQADGLPGVGGFGHNRGNPGGKASHNGTKIAIVKAYGRSHAGEVASLGSQAHPAPLMIGIQLINKAVMQTRRPTLPEFNVMRVNAVAAPEIWPLRVVPQRLLIVLELCR